VEGESLGVMTLADILVLEIALSLEAVLVGFALVCFDRAFDGAVGFAGVFPTLRIDFMLFFGVVV